MLTKSEFYKIVINDVKNFSIAEEHFEEDDELIGNLKFRLFLIYFFKVF